MKYIVLLIFMVGCTQLPSGTKIIVPQGHDPAKIRKVAGESTTRTGRVVELKHDMWLLK